MERRDLEGPIINLILRAGNELRAGDEQLDTLTATALAFSQDDTVVMGSGAVARERASSSRSSALKLATLFALIKAIAAIEGIHHKRM